MTKVSSASPYEKLLDRAFHARHPVYGSFEITYACNLACAFCYNPIERKNQARTAPPPDKGHPLSFEEIENALDQLRDLGILFLTLTGGEPIVHPRFWDIAHAAKKRTFALRVFSNGVGITPEVADRFLELQPNVIEISLHGARASAAEALNQVKGSHERQIRGIGLLKERNLRVYLKCVVTRLVEDQLGEIQALADRFDCPLYFDPVLTISDDKQLYPLGLKASDEAIASLYRTSGLNIGNSPFQREAGAFNCSVGTGTIHLDPYGNVLPCVQWKQAIGSLRETSLREIWDTSPLLKAALEASLKSAQVIKDTVPEHMYCAHCPGLSQLRTGDPLRPDEQYIRVAKIRSRVARESEPVEVNS